MSESLRKQTIVGTIWSAFQRFGTLILSFIANMVLARLLTPDEFGCIAMLSIFIVIADTFMDSGLGSAIIQKKDATDIDFSTVFYFNLAIAFILYCGLFIAAPAIARFYNIPLLSAVLRAEGLILIINSFSVVQTAVLRKQMQFKQLTIAILIATIVGVTVAIYMANKGYGVWSLVAQMLVTSLVRGIMLWILSHWKPHIVFSRESFKQLFGFGSFIFLSNLLNNIGNNIQGLIIGKAFNAGILGYYAQARKLEEIASTSLSGVIDQVTYPALAKKQQDLQAMVYVIRKLIKMIAFISFPLMVFLAIGGDVLIPLCYGEKWMQSVPFFRLLCIAGIAICLQGVNYNAVAAIGKSKSVFKWTVIKRTISLVLILIGLQWGIYGVLIGVVLGSYSILICNAVQVQFFLRYTLWHQFKDISPILLITTIAGIFSIAIGCIFKSHVAISFILELCVFGLVYFIGAHLMRLEAWQELCTIMKKATNRIK